MCNRCPTKVLDGKILMEAFLGKAPDISSLRGFGCKVQVLVPKEHRKKLEARRGTASLSGMQLAARIWSTYRKMGLATRLLLARLCCTRTSSCLRQMRTWSRSVRNWRNWRCPSLPALSANSSWRLEKEDVIMGPVDFEEELTTPASQPTRSEPVGVARRQARLREDPRQEKEVSLRVSQTAFPSPVNVAWSSKNRTSPWRKSATWSKNVLLLPSSTARMCVTALSTAN